VITSSTRNQKLPIKAIHPNGYFQYIPEVPANSANVRFVVRILSKTAAILTACQAITRHAALSWLDAGQKIGHVRNLVAFPRDHVHDFTPLPFQGTNTGGTGYIDVAD